MINPRSVEPPYRTWLTAGWNTYWHPDWIAVTVTKGPNWWPLDDRLRDALRPHRVVWDNASGMFLAPADTLPAILALNLGNRLRMRRLPDHPHRQVDTFLAERCILDPGHSTHGVALRSAWRNWCLLTGARPVSLKYFQEGLAQHGLTLEGNRGQRTYWRGVSLTR